jgi:tRNA-Thr(GGU) m(6)t(6)A37 methyltransferase TsaA
MSEIKIKAIGEVQQSEDGFVIKLKNEYKEGLAGLDGYSHLDIVWWADQTDDPEFRNRLIVDKPYKKGPARVGIFSTRSQIRPNPIALTPVYVIKIDHEQGTVYIPYIDAEPGTPVLDIKPYLPSTDIVKNVSVPEWCSHWPSSIEDSASFDWEKEFNF